MENPHFVLSTRSAVGVYLTMRSGEVCTLMQTRAKWVEAGGKFGLIGGLVVAGEKESLIAALARETAEEAGPQFSQFGMARLEDYLRENAVVVTVEERFELPAYCPPGSQSLNIHYAVKLPPWVDVNRLGPTDEAAWLGPVSAAQAQAYADKGSLAFPHEHAAIVKGMAYANAFGWFA